MITGSFFGEVGPHFRLCVQTSGRHTPIPSPRGPPASSSEAVAAAAAAAVNADMGYGGPIISARSSGNMAERKVKAIVTPPAPPTTGKIAQKSDSSTINSARRHMTAQGGDSQTAASSSVGTPEADVASGRPVILPSARSLGAMVGVVALRWQQDLQPLGILMPNEIVALAGEVVRSRIPCRRPKVLLLTDLPRLLLLDAAGCRILKEVDLVPRTPGSGVTSTTYGGLLSRTSFQVEFKSQTDFTLRAPGCRQLRCHDRVLGAEEWCRSIQAAREKARQWMGQTAGSPSSSSPLLSTAYTTAI